MKFIKLCCIIFIISSCTKMQPGPVVIDLGRAATSTSIDKVDPALSTGKVTLTMSVTEGAKYSIQLIDLKGDVKYSTGFTANNAVVIKQLDYSDVKSGDYTIVLLDIFGKEYKRNLTIKN